MNKRLRWCLAVLALGAASGVQAERETVLKQIRLPHNYYYREMYLPQLTSGPSALAWSPDGRQLVFSMQGSLWLQALDSDRARQLTAGPGYDYQPDWSPDGNRVVFTRYVDDALELQLLDLASGEVQALTAGGDVNLEPRFSPDGGRLAWVSTRDSGRFHVRVGPLDTAPLAGVRLRPERASTQVRYYYAGTDHELSPSWSPAGDALLFVANPENAYGTGGLWRQSLAPGAQPVLVRSEETTWKARPDWSPDGRRVTWSSYAGRQWHQLWLTTSAGGGDPVPMTYGDYDITAARWSPDGSRIAYISNQPGGEGIWIQDTVGGRRAHLLQAVRETLRPMAELAISVTGTDGKPVPSRIAVRGADGRAYAPDDAWVHGDDAFDRSLQPVETHYFHAAGPVRLRLPAGVAEVTVWRGLEHAVERRTVEVAEGKAKELAVALRPLDLPPGWAGQWASGDVHVHMNYAGTYRNTPERMVAQAEAEDVDFVFNLVVNKEQRIPDIGYFTTETDAASNERVVLAHDQEFHTGYWGHLGLLGLGEHYLLPDYSAYVNTGLASPYPDNATVADLAHRQGALVGYVHPYDAAPDPAADQVLTNALPVDAALGKVDYYEVSGFADYRETREVWYRLLNCGFRLAAAGGTDAMANYASLRGPVGLNRVYVEADLAGLGPAAREARWLEGLKAGRTMATNAPLLGLRVNGQGAGSELKLAAGANRLHVQGFMRSIVPMDHVELVFNGEVVADLGPGSPADTIDFERKLEVTEAGWLLLRAWNDGPSRDVFDRFPYGTTNPVFVEMGEAPVQCGSDADYFIAWIDRVRTQTEASEAYNTPREKAEVLAHLASARAAFEARR